MASDSTHRTMIDDHINALASDKMGNLWIATDGGLQVYNPRMTSSPTTLKRTGKSETTASPAYTMPAATGC